MKEHPILFSGPMVRAILEGHKTMTRRVLKSVILRGKVEPVTEFHPSDTPGYDWIMRDSYTLWNDLRNSDIPKRCPYGQPGDRLWVRETWGLCTDGLPNDGRPVNDDGVGCLYRATEPEAVSTEDNEKPCPWRPSIHMPRWACRIVLEITAVRVERLQDISEEDAKAEGIGQLSGAGLWKDYLGRRAGFAYPSQSFQSLWDSINADRGYGWDVNPWVWVVEFKPAASSQDAGREEP